MSKLSAAMGSSRKELPGKAPCMPEMRILII